MAAFRLLFLTLVFGIGAVLTVESTMAASKPEAGQSEEGSQGEGEKELPRTGTLSSTSIGGNEGKAVDEPWGGNDIVGQKSSPISGSVSKLTDKEWVAKIVNNSEHRYSVSLEVVQLDRRGKALKRTNFSYVLAPQETRERRLAVQTTTEQCALNLKSWKNLDGRDAEPGAKAAPETSSGGSAPQTAPE